MFDALVMRFGCQSIILGEPGGRYDAVSMAVEDLKPKDELNARFHVRQCNGNRKCTSL